MALVAYAAPFLRSWDVQMKPCGGLCPVAFSAACNHIVLVLAVHFISSSIAVMTHLRARILPLLSVSL